MVRVLIVDDSAVVRRVLERQLSQDPAIESMNFLGVYVASERTT